MTTKAQKLAQAAKAAAEVRAYQTDPDVVALRVERVRGWVDRLIWTGMVAGLTFTMANVAHFAAGGAKKWTLPWTTAWLLDPMVSLVLIGVLMGEQIINRHKLKAGGWVRATKWVALTCTYAMNTWSAWQALDPAQILLHSVPPAIVFCAAEAVVTIRQKITEAVTVAYEEAAARNAALEQARTRPAPVPAVRTDETRIASAPRADQTRTENPHAPVRTEGPHAAASAPQTEPVRTRAIASVNGRAGGTTGKPSGGASAVDRDALVAELAEQIREAVRAGEKWRPDYAALMERTGYKRRWCEEVVRDARHKVLRADESSELAEDADGADPRTDSAPETGADRADGPHADARAADAESAPDAEGARTGAGASSGGVDDGNAEPANAAELAGVGSGGERS